MLYVDGVPTDVTKIRSRYVYEMAKTEGAPAAVAMSEDGLKRQQFQRALAGLSLRENEVLEELLQGHYNKNIADHMGITPRTVEFHRANIFEKLQVNSAVELAHRMLDSW